MWPLKGTPDKADEARKAHLKHMGAPLLPSRSGQEAAQVEGWPEDQQDAERHEKTESEHEHARRRTTNRRRRNVGVIDWHFRGYFR